MENVEEHEDPWACGDHSEDDHLHLASSCHGASTRINSLSLEIFSKMITGSLSRGATLSSRFIGSLTEAASSS